MFPMQPLLWARVYEVFLFILKYKEGVPSTDELDLIIKLSELSVPDAPNTHFVWSGQARYKSPDGLVRAFVL